VAKRGRGETRALFIIIIVFSLLLGSATYLALSQNPPSSPSPGPAPIVPLYTWRVSLTIQIIRVDNTILNVTLPPNVGVAGGIWTNHTLDNWGIPGETAPLHTQSSSKNASASDGFVWVEPTERGLNFTIADFFNIWGQHITNACITLPNYGPACTGSKGVLDVEIGGFTFTNFAARPLSDGERISIVYVESATP